MAYRDVALTYLERGLLPLPVRGKRPVPVGATGRNGSVTPEKVGEWIRSGFRYLDTETGEWGVQDSATANVALRAEGWVSIDVDEYGDKHGAAQLAALEERLGPLPLTPSSTARGQGDPSRQWFYALPPGERVEMYGKPPIDGLDAKDIHIEIIQAHHRYAVVWPSIHPTTGSTYQWYDAEGEPMESPPLLSDFEYLPQAWVDYLRADAREYGHQGTQWDGEVPQAASEEEERKVRTIISRLQGLPEVWHEGAGWHDTVFGCACWLWRIARSNAYALTAPQAVQVLLDYTPTYPSWGVDKVIEQWESAEKVTAGQFEEPPAPKPKMLPRWTAEDFESSARSYPHIGNVNFFAVWAHTPTPDGAREHRAALLQAMLASGIDRDHAAVVTWNSAAARLQIAFAGQVILDAHSKSITLEQLWQEVAEAEAALTAAEHHSGEPGQAPAPVAPVAQLPQAHTPEPIAMSFLTDLERAQVLANNWWGRRFMDWAMGTFEAVNVPYFRMNRWTLLSIVFSPIAVLPKPGENDRPLNLYQAIAGRTTSGKTEALRPIKHVLKALYVAGDNPDVGGNFTAEALAEKLIEMDGKSTWFHVDEAHSKIALWKRPGTSFSEMPGALTEAYDGDISQISRASKKDLTEKGGARAFLTVHLMGTPEKMADVMGPDDWESGFLNRFVWAIGDPPTDSVDAMAGGWLTEEELDREEEETPDSLAIASGRKMYAQWAREFGSALMRVARPDGKPHRMRMPEEVKRRHQRFTEDLARIAVTSVYQDRLRPTFRRLSETIMRCAALVALSDGRGRIEMPDLLVAIEQAEEWARNILVMVAATDESLRTREVNMIEKALWERGAISVTEVHRMPRFQNRKKEVESMLDELIVQGRAWIDTTGGLKMLKIGGYANVA